MPRRKRKNKMSYFMFLIVLVAVFVTMAMQVRNNFENNDSTGVDDTSDVEQVKEMSDEEVKKVEEKTDEKIEEVEEKAIQYDGGSPNVLENLTGAINYVNVNGNKLSIRISIDQYLDDGICKLILKQDGNVVYQETVEIMGDATTSTCKGFDVPTAELNDSGEVQFTVYLDSGDRVGEISGGVNL